MTPHTRPRPSAIDQLPEECEAIVAWAAQELANTPKSQTEIYAEFRMKLIALQGELGLAFDIPHFSSFNRHALRLAKVTHRLQRSQMIADAVVARTDGEDADKLTQASTRLLKTIIFEMMENAADDGFVPKEAHQAAAALYRLSMAENVSTQRRQKLQAEIASQAREAVETVAKAKGLSDDTAQEILSKILGVEKA
ncbi:DUF3486 family protein [Shinella sp. CPCC 100929]|uniref:DUF3486 family protein n=1 Tax=Shinella lacus TaxID=2654216 RepID=A0ABT1R6X4_9HYPH|nr:DUF3486 family protein [Shinella lacus]MCQ4630925.1 DUF3486 family protein [Shinella lacus]